METQNETTRALEDVGDALRRQPSVRDEVMRRIAQQVATAPVRQGRRRVIGKLIAIAACVVVGLLIWNPWGRGIGASEAFAAAIANVERAHTFACRQIVTQVDKDGQKTVREMTFMFREPNLGRLEYGEGLTPEIMVTDFATKVRLVLMPEDKVASLQDLSTTYAVDEKTGQLKPIKLGTDARDDVLRISAQAVKDLGKANVNGREVRALQSADGVEPVKTVYVNPADGKPVEVELAWPSTGESFVYTDIQIDTDLDEKLFSLQPPDGYEMAGGHAEPRKPVDDINGQLMAKMKHLMMECAIYANEHGGKWPTRLDDLRAAGMDATKLQTLITATDSKDGKPVIEYRQPKAGQVEGVVAYEIPEIRRGGKVVAGFMDGHVELMSKEDFDAQVK